MFTKEEIALAEPCYEAIKKIGGNVEKKCRGCDGGSLVFPKGSNCTNCNGTGRVRGKWEWEPEVGEWFMDAKLGPYLIYVVGDCFIEIAKDNGETCFSGMSDKFIPILHWEKIEEILEGMGYYVRVDGQRRRADQFVEYNYYCNLYKVAEDNREEAIVIFKGGKSRQLAVMRAVIELGKEE